jgi:uncharacterized membrane protein
MELTRLFKHLMTSHWQIRQCFPPSVLTAIEQAVAASEHRHRGELRVVVEGPLPLGLLLRNVSARARATELFSRLRIWDTAENSGILIYLQLADRRVEILADRGIATKVPQAYWDGLCQDMERAFSQGSFKEGTLDAVAKAGVLLIEHFPAMANGSDNPDELPDRPLIL